jgi:FAD/FMN-containing dehydrogenase
VPSSPTVDVAGLAAAVGPEAVVSDPVIRAAYEVDWTRRFHGRAAAIVRPRTVDGVAATLAWCNERGVAVVPQGGNTGLVAGGVPVGAAEGAIVLSLRHLDAVGPVDELAAQVSVGPGLELDRLSALAGVHGFEFGVDLGARATATIGGMVATNAGGIRVLRYGAMRAQVLGTEAALADGSVVRHMAGLAKDNTGYDLTGLLVGSEGTLGVVTAARLRLVPRLPDRLVVLAGIPTVGEAVEVVAELRHRVDGLDAVEAVLGDGLALMHDQLGLAPPFADAGGVLVLVEWAGRGEPPSGLAAVLERYPSAAATDPGGRARLWRYREGMAEAIAMVGVPHKLDVTLPAAELAGFVASVPAVVTAAVPAARVHLFGHLADGNVHVNVTGADVDDERVDDAVLHLVAEHGGSISAEHGVGRAKAKWLGLSRTASEIAAFRAIKRALDPAGILNPGVILT